MSKSLNNFFTIRDVLKKYHPEVVRYFLLSSHYRSPINYSEDNLIEARQGLERFYFALQNFSDVVATAQGELENSLYYQRFVAAMDDDFNTREAFSAMYDLVRELNTVARKDQNKAQALAGELKALGEILGVLQVDPKAFLKGSSQDDGGLSDTAIEALIAERKSAKLAKNYARADEMREELKQQGVILEDSREGTRWRRD